MNNELNLGPQPLAEILETHSLKPHDLVVASTEQLTHKMVARAVKGRRLTKNTRNKVLAALNQATGMSFRNQDLFNY